MSLYMSLGAIAGTVGTFVITMVITLYGLDKSYLLMTFGIATTVVLFFVLGSCKKIKYNYHLTNYLD